MGSEIVNSREAPGHAKSGHEHSGAAPQRPAPQPGRDSAFFWEGAARGVLLGQRCDGCGDFRHPPRPMCPRCHSLKWRAVPLCGRGRIYSWIRPVHPPLPFFDSDNLVALIELEEGIRLLSNLVEISVGKIEIGMQVEVTFAPTAGGGAVPVFRPLHAIGKQLGGKDG